MMHHRAENGRGRPGSGVYEPLVAILCAVAVLLALDLVGRVVYSRIVLVTSYDAPRNPYFHRGWRVYTSPVGDRKPHTKRVIVITNSQGWLREHENGELAYPAVLSRLLNERDASVRWEVLNWSLPAGTPPEMVVLAARTAVHQPDLLILSTSLANYRRIGEKLSFYATDVGLLAPRRSVHRLLSERFRREFATSNYKLWLGDHTGLGRLRWLTIEGVRDEWFPMELRTGFGGGKLWNARALTWPEPRRAAWLLREFAQTYHRGTPRGRLIAVAHPLDSTAWSAEDWNRIVSFPELMASALRGDADLVLDGTCVIPPGLFATASHFQPEAHRRFAEWLAPHILEVLATSD